MPAPPQLDRRALIVNFIPDEVVLAELQAIFEQWGPLVSCNLALDKDTQKTRGFGFVTFERVEDAERAMQGLNGFPMYGKTLKVTVSDPARSREPHDWGWRHGHHGK